METTQVDIIVNTSNATVIKLSGRKFPGMVIQGDSLKILCDLSDEICNLFQDNDMAEAISTALELQDILKNYLKSYEAILHSQDLDLPYTKS